MLSSSPRALLAWSAFSKPLYNSNTFNLSKDGIIGNGQDRIVSTLEEKFLGEVIQLPLEEVLCPGMSCVVAGTPPLVLHINLIVSFVGDVAL